MGFPNLRLYKIKEHQELPLVVNKKVVKYLKARYKQFPMFRPLDSKTTKEYSLQEFKNTHRKLFKTFSNVFDSMTTHTDPDIVTGGAWLSIILESFVMYPEKFKGVESIIFKYNPVVNSKSVVYNV